MKLLSLSLTALIAVLTPAVNAAGVSAPFLNDSTFLLTSDAAVADNTRSFTRALQAIDAVNSAAASHRNVTLYIEPGVYWLDDPDDPAVRVSPRGNRHVPFAAEIRCDTLSIIGLSDNPEDVVWAVNRGQTQGALGNYTMLRFVGHSLTAGNITFGNYCNVDLEYPRDPSLNRARRRDAVVQAQIGLLEGTDRLFARNCRFISRLNLCPLTGARRSFYKDCYFECTDDALTGSAVYQDCRFAFHSGKPFYSTASTGAVLLNCDIVTLTNGTQYLTKAPGIVTLIDTRFTSDHPVDIRWTRDASAVRCYQSNVTLNGRPLTVDIDRPQLSADITGSPLLEAFRITVDGKVIYNTPNLLGGNDGWDPLGLSSTVTDAEKSYGHRLTGLPVVIRLSPSVSRLESTGDTAHITPSARLWGDYEASLPSGTTFNWLSPNFLRLSSSDGNATVVSDNAMPASVNGEVSVNTSCGLVAATTITIAPHLSEAPRLTATPSITRSGSDLKLDYSLDRSGEDASYIVWYRSKNPDMTDSVAVRHGHGLTARTYPLSAADKGYNISARIYPKLRDSRQSESSATASFGSSVSAMMPGLLKLKETSLVTSFAEIPIRSNGAGKPGLWHFDTYKPADTSGHDWQPQSGTGWRYGNGEDAAASSLGLVQASRGARLSYTPTVRKCHGMKLTLTVEPCKGAGQGFGSATGQYMDICLNFDPVTLTGYALRIERTPDYDKAVTFTLVSYKNGVVAPISEPVPSSCYRNPCTISLEVTKDMLTASASTAATVTGTSDARVKPSVSLSAPVEMLPHTSVAIQHTGSTGASASLLRDLNVNWKLTGLF